MILKMALFENALSLYRNQNERNFKTLEEEHRKQNFTVSIMILGSNINKVHVTYMYVTPENIILLFKKNLKFMRHTHHV